MVISMSGRRFNVYNGTTQDILTHTVVACVKRANRLTAFLWPFAAIPDLSHTTHARLVR